MGKHFIHESEYKFLLIFFFFLQSSFSEHFATNSTKIFTIDAVDERRDETEMEEPVRKTTVFASLYQAVCYVRVATWNPLLFASFAKMYLKHSGHSNILFDEAKTKLWPDAN